MMEMSAEPWNAESLGAPAEPQGWTHGEAGRVADGCRVDCWLAAGSGGVREARFEVFAGPEAMKAAAWLADWLAGRPFDAAAKVTGLWLAERVDMPDEARGTGLCIEDALRSALAAMAAGEGGSEI